MKSSDKSAWFHLLPFSNRLLREEVWLFRKVARILVLTTSSAARHVSNCSSTILATWSGGNWPDWVRLTQISLSSLIERKSKIWKSIPTGSCIWRADLSDLLYDPLTLWHCIKLVLPLFHDLDRDSHHLRLCYFVSWSRGGGVMGQDFFPFFVLSSLRSWFPLSF